MRLRKEACPDLPDDILPPLDFGFNLMEVEQPEILSGKILELTQGKPGYEKIERALALAFKAHEKQTRFEGKPYIVHPLRGALRLIDFAHRTTNELPPADYVYMALLHDSLEDSEKVSAEEIRAAFGDFVHDGVQLLTKYLSNGNIKTKIDNGVYFEGINGGTNDTHPRLTEAVQIVKVIDRIDNTQSLTNLVNFPGDPRLFIHEQIAETRQFVAPIARKYPVLCHELHAAVVNAQRHEGIGIFRPRLLRRVSRR